MEDVRIDHGLFQSCPQIYINKLQKLSMGNSQKEVEVINLNAVIEGSLYGIMRPKKKEYSKLRIKFGKSFDAHR